jgi:hypothetical protein
MFRKIALIPSSDKNKFFLRNILVGILALVFVLRFDTFTAAGVILVIWDKLTGIHQSAAGKRTSRKSIG